MTVRIITLEDIPNPHLKDAWNQKKKRAHNLIHQAIKLGILKKPDRCSDCKLIPKRLHAHHEDYDEPLDIIWVCSACHNRRHGYGLTGKYARYN